ncbi:MAG: hypothetical protein LAP39_24320 [Acidobacteriia bacterium]|nr:hypothetical protein [Terriglobia bacterium]
MNAILEMLTLRRAQSGDPNLGAGMEKRIIEAELVDLERAMAALESMEDTARPNPQRAGTDL